MRLNVYSQELRTDMRGGSRMDQEEPYHKDVELVTQESNTGVVYSAVRLFLHSSEHLHHPPMDDDRSAITFWLPKSPARRAAFADQLRFMANLVEQAPRQTGLD